MNKTTFFFLHSHSFTHFYMNTHVIQVTCLHILLYTLYYMHIVEKPVSITKYTLTLYRHTHWSSHCIVIHTGLLVLEV